VVQIQIQLWMIAQLKMMSQLKLKKNQNQSMKGCLKGFRSSNVGRSDVCLQSHTSDRPFVSNDETLRASK
jgi:hypothetical protein